MGGSRDHGDGGETASRSWLEGSYSDAASRTCLRPSLPPTMGTSVPVIGSHGVPSARLRPVPPSVFCFFVVCSSSLAAAASRFGGGTSAMLEMIGSGQLGACEVCALRGDGVLLEEMRQQVQRSPEASVSIFARSTS